MRTPFRVPLFAEIRKAGPLLTETLRAQRIRLRRPPGGEEIDLEAYFDRHVDFKAGPPMAQGVYQRVVPARRELSVVLLIDISGSTDAWVSSNKRIIDVEREAISDSVATSLGNVGFV
jgi:nitric oxide reductase NorD protein